MGEEMVGFRFSILLLTVSLLQTEGWEVRRTTLVQPVQSDPWKIQKIGISAQNGNVAQIQYLPYYYPFLNQDTAKIVSANIDLPIIGGQTSLVNPGVGVGYTVVIPYHTIMFLNQLFNMHYRNSLLSFLNKYSLRDIISLHALNAPHSLTDQHINLLKILQAYAQQQSYMYQDNSGKEKEMFKYLNYILTKFYEYQYGNPTNPYGPSGDGKPDQHVDINMWKFPDLAHTDYPQDFMIIMKKYPSILAPDSPDHEKSLMAIIANILNGLDDSTLTGNTVDQHKYPPELLSLLYKLHGVPDRQRSKIVYDFLNNFQNPDVLMRYIYMLYSLSKNPIKVPNDQSQYVIVTTDMESMMKSVINDLLPNLNVQYILNNPGEQQKYSPDLLKVIMNLYNSANKEQQYAIIYDFLKNQKDKNALLDLMSEIRDLIQNQEKKDNIIIIPTNITPPDGPSTVVDPADNKKMMIKQINDIAKTIDIPSLLSNPVMQKTFPPELLKILLQMQNIKSDDEKYLVLFSYLMKQDDPNTLMTFLKALYMYSLDTQMNQPVPGGDKIVPPLDTTIDTEFIVKIIDYILDNQNILGLVIDSTMEQKYPVELLNILTELQTAPGKKNKFRILYDFLNNQKDPTAAVEYVRILLELGKNPSAKPDEKLQPDIKKSTIVDVIRNVINNPNILNVITNPEEQKMYPHELMSILIEMNKMDNSDRQFDKLYEFLTKQNDVDLLTKYIYLLLRLSGIENPLNDLVIDLPISKKCSPGNIKVHDCMDCVCSKDGIIVCVIKRNCSAMPSDPAVAQCVPYTKFMADGCNTCECGPDGVPICTLIHCVFEKPLRCLPYSRFQLDQCNACECTKDGFPLCAVSECSSKEKLHIAMGVLAAVTENGVACSPETSVTQCAPGTEWVVSGTCLPIRKARLLYSGLSYTYV